MSSGVATIRIAGVASRSRALTSRPATGSADGELPSGSFHSRQRPDHEALGGQRPWGLVLYPYHPERAPRHRLVGCMGGQGGSPRTRPLTGHASLCLVSGRGGPWMPRNPRNDIAVICPRVRLSLASLSAVGRVYRSAADMGKHLVRSQESMSAVRSKLGAGPVPRSNPVRPSSHRAGLQPRP